MSWKSEHGEVECMSSFEIGFKSALSNEWVSVKDILPEYNDDVLVTGENSDIYIAHLSELYDEPSEFYCHAGCIKYVTHWMPLPSPPKESTCLSK